MPTVCPYVYCLSVCLLSVRMSTVCPHVYCLPVCLLSARMSTVCPYVYCLSVCLLSARMSTVCPHVYCLPACLLSVRMSTVCPYVYCLSVCLLSVRMSTVCPYAYCLSVCLLSARMSTVCPYVYCLPVCLLSARMPTVCPYVYCLSVCLLSVRMSTVCPYVYCLSVCLSVDPKKPTCFGFWTKSSLYKRLTQRWTICTLHHRCFYSDEIMEDETGGIWNSDRQLSHTFSCRCQFYKWQSCVDLQVDTTFRRNLLPSSAGLQPGTARLSETSVSTHKSHRTLLLGTKTSTASPPWDPQMSHRFNCSLEVRSRVSVHTGRTL
jgi:hypothetical protein